MKYDVADLSLAAGGKKRILWADHDMPVLAAIRNRFVKNKPLKGRNVSACLHVTAETANLIRVLKAGGAEVRLCASNPLSTQDDVAAAIVADLDVPVYAIHGEDSETYYQHIHQSLDHGPHFTMDDGADLVSTLHKRPTELLEGVLGGTEETTTGVIRLRAMAVAGIGWSIWSRKPAVLASIEWSPRITVSSLKARLPSSGSLGIFFSCTIRLSAMRWRI